MSGALTQRARSLLPPRAIDLALVGLALLLRLFRADAQSLWYDEGTSAALAGRAPSEILLAAANDIHPPLYYLLLSAWTRLLGDGVPALRGLSALAGALTIAGLLAVGHRLLPHRPRFVWLAGLLAATAPFLVWYGQEVRMYAMAAALGAWLIWLALVVTEDGSQTTDKSEPAPPPRWAWPTLLLLTLAALHTQYVAGAAAVLAANLVAAGRLLAMRRTADRWPLRIAGTWTAVQTLSLLLFLPWLTTAWPTLSSWPAVGGELSTAGMLAEALRTYALGIRAPDTALALVAIPISLAALGAVLGLVHPPTRALTTVALAWAASPPLLIAILSLRRTTWKPKFVLVGAPGFELLLAIGILITAALLGRAARRLTFSRDEAALQRNTTIATLAGATVLLAALAWPRALTLHANTYDPAHQRDDYRGAIAEIVERAGPDDAVLLVAPTQVELFDYYAPEGLARYPLPLERPPSLQYVHTELTAIAADHKNIHALLYAEREADPKDLIEAWLDTYLAKAYDRWRGDVRQAMWASCGFEPSGLPEGQPMPGTAIATFSRFVAITHFVAPTAQAKAGDALCMEITWSPLGIPATDYHVFWQILDADGRLVAQRDDMAPLNGREQTSNWGIPAPFSMDGGRPHLGRLALALPPDLPPGRYRSILGLYDPATGGRLTVVVPTDGTGSEGTPFTVGEPPDHLRLPDVVIIEGE